MRPPSRSKTITTGTSSPLFWLCWSDVESAGRFGVLGQEAGLAGGGDVVDLRAAEEAGDAEREPDSDRHPAPARAR